MSQVAPAVLRNAQALPVSSVPRASPEDFAETLASAVERELRVSALFGAPSLDGRGLEIYAVLCDDDEGEIELLRTVVQEGSFPSISSAAPQAHMFEREIVEQWGATPRGHPWLKPVRFAPSREVQGEDRKADPPSIGITDFYRVEGEQVHEVAVGPVHAGVIEPGHFRFQCHGEEVFHLEISLGYQHRGVERALVGGPGKRAIHHAETLSGDTTIGHATAYCHAIESLSRSRVPARAHVLRAVALELERLANHTGDLGALAGDVGFLPTASFCGRLRGDFLNLTALLCGSRFGRGLIRPGGVVFDADERRAHELRERLDGAFRDVRGAVNLLWSTASVQSRFEGTGVVAQETARELGLVGVAARGCGLTRDVRHDFPVGAYRFTQVPVSQWHTGDVFARAYVRWREIERSVAFVREQLASLPASATRAPVGNLAPESICVSLVEGWRGEICHVAITDDRGRFAAYKVVDPSFHNWTALAMALRGQAISDFPLCNKSFNLSYCGFDL